jgi:signal transduction histidine kinase
MWLLLGLLALLPGMAFMQYRWIGQVSDAARERAKSHLENSVEQLVTEFDAEITRAHLAFWSFPSAESEDATERFTNRFREWNRLAPYPQLIRDAYLIDSTEDPWRLSRIDSFGELKPVPQWPAELVNLRSRMEQSGPAWPPGFRRMGGGDDLSVNGNPAFLFPLRAPRPEGERSPEREVRPDGERRRGTRGTRDWASRSRTVGWAVVSFDAQFIRNEFLPELTKRVFLQNGESDYDLLVTAAGKPDTIIFQSATSPAHGAFASPDATAGFFAMRPDCFIPLGASAQGNSGGRPDMFLNRTKEILTQKPSACGSAARALGSNNGKWTLLVKHRAGSLDAAFATFRIRTLAISFGVLLVLALGITMLTISAERARVLAKLQMEFAMGVSHELRTPLTVIRVAADNLANGMMTNAQHAKKYGQMIGDEARRLTDMVERILVFARSQSSEHSSDLAPTAPEHIVRRALDACGTELREAGMEVERFVEPDLPLVLVDEKAIADCVQNLIHNAVKYANSGRWLRVRAESVPHANGVRVRISVEDRGPGVDPDDLPHIFDPFYRSEAVRNSQLPGVGLGLSLVKRIVEAHHGSIEVRSAPESGACFFIDLPAETAAVPVESEVKEVAS